MEDKGVVMKMVSILPEQYRALQNIKRKSGITQTHMIREGIDLAIERYTRQMEQQATRERI
jgi:Ribbon-helix-helix domain